MGAIQIRCARLADVEAVEDYHARCFAKTYSSQLLAGHVEPPDREGVRRQFREWFAPESDVGTRVVVVDGTPIAHFAVGNHRLIHLFVDPDYQGKGLGGELLARAEATIADEGHDEFELHTRVDNFAAIAFYERAGWAMTERVVHTVEHDISYDEHVMTKQRP